MSSVAIKLIIGLCNPGSNYASTRHNAGAWFLEELCSRLSITLKENTKLQSKVDSAFVGTQKVILAVPTTYMNHSGFAVRKLMDFYKIDLSEILIAHDELDLPPGTVRLKAGGGHGGNNGLRHIIEQLGGKKDFLRLRIGIGHPGNKSKVTGHVLSAPSADDKISIDTAIEAAIRQVDSIVKGQIDAVMNELHSYTAGAN